MATTKPIVRERLIAHRGASAHAPENTLAAVRKAKQMGATWIETDVRLTSDGKLVMIHDDTLDRTTSGTGAVLKADLEQIRGLDAGGWHSEEYSAEAVPTLQEFVECILDEGLKLQLELKEVFGLEDRLVQDVCDCLKAHWPIGEREIFLSGFSERCMRLAAMELPNVPRCLAVTVTPRDPALRLTETGCQILHLQNDYLDDASLNKLNLSGIEFAVATVNDPVRATNLIAAGAQTVLTDDPEAFQTALAEPSM